MTFWEIYYSDMHSCTDADGASNQYDCKQATPLPQAAYEDNYVAHNAIELMRTKTPNTPWFLQVSFPGPHPPFVVTAAMMNSTHNISFPLAHNNPSLDKSVQQVQTSSLHPSLPFCFFFIDRYNPIVNSCNLNEYSYSPIECSTGLRC